MNLLVALTGLVVTEFFLHNQLCRAGLQVAHHLDIFDDRFYSLLGRPLLAFLRLSPLLLLGLSGLCLGSQHTVGLHLSFLESLLLLRSENDEVKLHLGDLAPSQITLQALAKLNADDAHVDQEIDHEN